MRNAGEFGCPTQKCGRALGVQFFYDDPLQTPIVGLEIDLQDAQGNVLIPSIPTETPMARGMEDGTQHVAEVRQDLGGVIHGEVPLSAGASVATTNPSQDIESAADEAWEIEKQIVGNLWDFEQQMKAAFAEYVQEWEEEGWLGAGGDFVSGIGSGIAAWWNGEKEFWGSIWGALRSTTAVPVTRPVVPVRTVSSARLPGQMGDIPRGYETNMLDHMAHMDHFHRTGENAVPGIHGDYPGQQPPPPETSDGRSWGDILDAGVEMAKPLVELMRAMLTGDIDEIMARMRDLRPLEKVGGVIGEFAAALREALDRGVIWLGNMIEMFRRTPVLNLICNTMMRVITMMTPNFWAKAMGQLVGFIIPEVIITIVSKIIAALASVTIVGAAAGAALIAARFARIADMARSGIKAVPHVAKVGTFVDELGKIIKDLPRLAGALGRSIKERADDIWTNRQQFFRTSRYWNTKLDDLARQGHGPQKHEGDVTGTQLFDRVYRGVDPETGAIRRNAKGNIIGVGKHSTKFNTPADYVRAYEKALKHPDYDAFVKSADARVEITVKMSDVFGSRFHSRISGYSIVSGKVGQNPTIAKTAFGPDTNIIVRFRRENGIIKLTTLYPNP
ncbi:hypothetical protein [Pseudaestuariivita rosea]|uniref:hypothetical protein n=1 Tax=Pseudaestuariivita rosea TaxID=2763263 RepID=UPI001ABA5433|nr:hypothetical protein [Pseudaestuariivita rosea]